MAETITIRTDEETEHALDALTGEGISRSAAIRQAVIHAAERRERAAQLRRAVLAMDIPDGDWTEGGGRLGAMVRARSDLAAGDLRLLYLAWPL
ncbi:MAG TPA: hypothetical protein VNF47_00350 [Streptosporangiaceae bacterium]|nr:hypothetical protein [Streptosporangiaceae bacterium]